MNLWPKANNCALVIKLIEFHLKGLQLQLIFIREKNLNF